VAVQYQTLATLAQSQTQGPAGQPAACAL